MRPVAVRRVAMLAVAILAVVALATVAASLDSVSTAPAVDTDSTPVGTADSDDGGGGGGGGDGEGRGDGGDVDASSGSDTGSETGLALWQVAAGLGLLLVGSAVALYGLTRGSEVNGNGDASSDPEPTAPAADSVTLAADVPATNDVYRAWNSLCRATPVESAGRTPADVARAAVEADHAADAVTELTEAFCAVRYGDVEPTSERERRARELAAALSLPLEGES
jgi:hypothetical protein